MPKVMKICKACGKEYEACRTPNPGVFRWRDIACSPECAEKYIHDVQVARGEIVEAENNSAPAINPEPVIETVTYGYGCSVDDEPEAVPEEPVKEFVDADDEFDRTSAKRGWNRKK